MSNEAAYATMVADPCNGPLLEGFYSSAEGMLNKLKTTVIPSGTSANGYILWDPNYTSASTSSGDQFNCVLLVSANASDQPANAAGDGFGKEESNGLQLQVGAAGFAQSDTVADARCVGACIRATYKGRMDAASGLICVVNNLPAEAVLGADGLSPIAVDELFALATIVERAGIDTAEVKFRPSESSQIFRSNDEGVFTYRTDQPTFVTAEAERVGSTLMGFGFQGVTSMADFLFEFHQNIEWRPNVDAGFVLKLSNQMKPPGHALNIVRKLDNKFKDWWTNLKGLGNSSNLAQIAFTGAMPRLMAQAERAAITYGARAAPMLLTL